MTPVGGATDDVVGEFTGAEQRWMQRAMSLARLAEAHDEVPVGAVLVYQDKIIGEGFNQTIRLADPTAHAEILALRMAAQHLNNYRLPETVLFTTLEPCSMCAGGIVNARVKRVVFAATDSRAGAAGSIFSILDEPRLNHRCQVSSGLLADESAQLLKSFFSRRR